MRKRTVNVGTIGHVSQDKTTLVAALMRMVEHDSQPVVTDEIEFTLNKVHDDIFPMALTNSKPRKSKRINQQQKRRGF